MNLGPKLSSNLPENWCGSQDDTVSPPDQPPECCERKRESFADAMTSDFLCERAGAPVYNRGREVLVAHRGMKISESDWNVFLGHAAATLAKFKVPEPEQRDVVAFVHSLKNDIVE